MAFSEVFLTCLALHTCECLGNKSLWYWITVPQGLSLIYGTYCLPVCDRILVSLSCSGIPRTTKIGLHRAKNVLDFVGVKIATPRKRENQSTTTSK